MPGQPKSEVFSLFAAGSVDHPEGRTERRMPCPLCLAAYTGSGSVRTSLYSLQPTRNWTRLRKIELSNVENRSRTRNARSSDFTICRIHFVIVQYRLGPALARAVL
eukprot:3347869-Prymnesium_polylepis.1